MVWDYRLSVICDPRLMGGQCVINRASLSQARLILPAKRSKNSGRQSLRGLFDKEEAAT